MVAFPEFTEHPASCFLDEIFFVGEEDLGDGKGIVEVVKADEVEGGDDGESAFPEVGRDGPVVEEGAVFVFEEGTDDFFDGKVDEVPVVDGFTVFDVEVEDFLSFRGGFGGFIELGDEDEEGEEAFFVEGGIE